MTKATRILNEYHIKELILNGNPQYDNFYKDELIEFCKISKQEIDRLNNIINKLEELISIKIIRHHNEKQYVAVIEDLEEIYDRLKELKDSD